MRYASILMATAALLAAPAARTHAASITNVYIIDDDFSINTADGPIVDATIKLGDTVHWIWTTFSEHSTTSAAGQLESWHSGDQTNPATFDHTFTNLGVFNYYCDIHGFDAGGGQVVGMSGSITVLPVPEPASGALALGGIAFLAGRRRRK